MLSETSTRQFGFLVIEEAYDVLSGPQLIPSLLAGYCTI